MNRKVAVVGAGVMGHGIAQVFAASGFPTTLIDTDPRALRAALRRIRANLDTLVKLRVLSAAAARSALGRIRTTCSLADGVAGAAFVQETIAEIADEKRALFRALEPLAGDALLGSNAATVPIGRIAAGLRARERIVGVHWVNPPYVIPVVELIPSKWTSERTVTRTRSLLRRAGKVPVLCRDIPGKIIARVQFAMMNEAIDLLQSGAASAEDIDTAIRLSTGIRLAVFGPLRFLDLVSTHRNTLNGMDFLYRATGDRKFRPQPLLAKKVKEGRLGIWSGEGWYRYHASYRRLAEQRDRLLIRAAAALAPLRWGT